MTLNSSVEANVGVEVDDGVNVEDGDKLELVAKLELALVDVLGDMRELEHDVGVDVKDVDKREHVLADDAVHKAEQHATSNNCRMPRMFKPRCAFGDVLVDVDELALAGKSVVEVKVDARVDDGVDVEDVDELGLVLEDVLEDVDELELVQVS
eukprot:6210544-Amphidinium_carterae.1